MTRLGICFSCPRPSPASRLLSQQVRLFASSIRRVPTACTSVAASVTTHSYFFNSRPTTLTLPLPRSSKNIFEGIRTMALFAPGPDNLFAKMVRGEIPCSKVAESEHWLAFLDINPLSKGHTLIIPKVNVQRAHEVPAECMATFGPFLSKIIKTVVPAGMGYNILQNNGTEAHQFVMYVHFHIIPKPDDDSGLQMSWSPKPPTKEELAEQAAEYRKIFEELP